VAVAAALGVFAALAGPMAGALEVGHEPALVSSRTYVVRPGDSLWSIAAAVSPDAALAASAQHATQPLHESSNA
jgi:Tfp pilus assembly protein FimV